MVSLSPLLYAKQDGRDYTSTNQQRQLYLSLIYYRFFECGRFLAKLHNIQKYLRCNFRHIFPPKFDNFSQFRIYQKKETTVLVQKIRKNRSFKIFCKLFWWFDFFRQMTQTDRLVMAAKTVRSIVNINVRREIDS